MNKKDIIKILMIRDELTFDEAKEIVNETQELIDEALKYGEFMEVEEIMYDQLGLEMDYITAFM